MPVHRGLEGPAELAARLHGIDPASLAGKSKDEGLVTNAEGVVVPDLSHAMNVSGFPVSSDVFLFEKQQTFNRAKTLERMVHPAGSGALGYFEVTTDFASKLTKASFLSNIGKQTPIIARFSTVTYGREFPDSARNPRGFALKFYTEDGNYDLVGLNFPVFFVRDPMMGPDVIRSQQRNPANFLLDWQAVVDFMANVPESLHAGTMYFSDHGTPVGWRFMDGYGCHTFKWVNNDGAYVYVKYHFISQNGVKQFNNEEAVKMCGEDPDFAKRDLWEHLEKGGTAVWKLYVQVMTQAQADACPYDPFDVTKVWYRKDFPMHEVGRLILNKNPENYHRDIEQVAFSPGSMVPGVEPSYDELLNWRMFFYRDAQYHRLGTNLHQIPVNCPFMAKNYNPMTRDGPLRSDTNGGKAPAYFPNSDPSAPCPSRMYDFQPIPVQGPIARNRNKYEGTDKEYEQVRELYSRVMTDQQRKNLHKNISIALKYCNATVKEKFLAQLEKIHLNYAQGVREACKLLAQNTHPEVLSVKMSM